jgi:UDP-3-O-acyl-N-acetylglucosamine deacetylase
MAGHSLRVAPRQEAHRARTFTLMADSCMLRILDEGLGGSLLAQCGPTLDRTAIAEVRHNQLSKS